MFGDQPVKCRRSHAARADEAEDGKIVFTPEPSFSGTATPVDVASSYSLGDGDFEHFLRISREITCA